MGKPLLLFVHQISLFLLALLPVPVVFIRDIPQPLCCLDKHTHKHTIPL